MSGPAPEREAVVAAAIDRASILLAAIDAAGIPNDTGLLDIREESGYLNVFCPADLRVLLDAAAPAQDNCRHDPACKEGRHSYLCRPALAQDGADPADGLSQASTTSLILHAKTEDPTFMRALQREERRWRRGSNTRSLAHLRNVMHSIARVLDGHAALADAEESMRDA